MAKNRPVFSFCIILCLLLLENNSSKAQEYQEGMKLVGAGAVPPSWQGRAVSLSYDGNTAIVGGSEDNANTGAAWIYYRTAGVWSQQGTKLVGTGAVGTAYQGKSVAISGDGNTAIVGGYTDNSFVGAAWVYTRSGGVWSQQGSKLVGTGANQEAYQGTSVALSDDGNTALVGGDRDDFSAGAVWVFTRTAGIWSQQGAKLVGTGAVGPAYQGHSVSLSADGNTAIVGGYADNSSIGAVWIFTRSGGIWTQQGSKLVGTGYIGSADQGISVSISADGNNAIVGGQSDNSSVGAAWIYTKTGGVWTQQGEKLVGTSAVGAATQGCAVSITGDGNTAIVGGWNDNGDAGAAWIYARNGGVWTQLGSKLAGTGGGTHRGYSVAVSADGNSALVGGFKDDNYVGAAWVYYRVGPPTITAVNDIPNDQGGQIRLEWDNSPADNPDVVQVSSYGIFRKSPEGMTVPGISSRSIGATPFDESLIGYDFVATVPAYQLSHYQTVVPTLQDSTSAGTHYFRFVVVAQSTVLGQYYLSDVDSGYSVDNLAPIPPAGLMTSVGPSPQVELTWNSPTDPDVGYYNVYRSGTSGFTPGEGNKIGMSNTMSFTDCSPIVGSPSYYKIIAVDIHDNASEPSTEAKAAVTVNNEFSVNGRWNIISVPLSMSDYTKTVLFPTATTNAFTFEDGYVAHATLENGRGYWMKFSSGETISQYGLERTNDTIVVAEGWNMVGALSNSLSMSNISSIPGGIVTSSFYGYDNGYSPSSILEPGRGYWVKVSEAGQLVMSDFSSAKPENRIRIEDTGEMPPPPPDEVSSAVPNAYSLDQNYPNPFNPVTNINYALPTSEHVRLTVFNMLGQEVAVLVDGIQEAGLKTVTFDVGILPSGVYTYRITAGAFNDVKRMLLLK